MNKEGGRNARLFLLLRMMLQETQEYTSAGLSLENNREAETLLSRFEVSKGRVSIYRSSQGISKQHWEIAFEGVSKGLAYYFILERAITDGFEYFFVHLEDQDGGLVGIQPIFLVRQDLVTGMPGAIRTMVAKVRDYWSSFLKAKLLMVGCTAGDCTPGVVKGKEAIFAEMLSDALVSFSAMKRPFLIVCKDVSSRYRPVFSWMRSFVRIPSFPNVRMDLDFVDFDDFIQKRLSKVTRKGLRRKFRDSEVGAPIEMEVRSELGPYLEDAYGLYKQVFDRSEFRFEELTRDFFQYLGEEMPDRVRFFLWKREGKLVAFSLCLVHGETIADCYLGLDYSLAHQLHLYFVTLRDVMEWSVKNGYKEYVSTPLNYDPKQHLRFLLDPLDLYIRHPSRWLNAIIAPFIKILGPTGYDPVLKRFENAEVLFK